MSGDLGNLSVGVLAFEFNYIFLPLSSSLSVQQTLSLRDLEVGTAASMACGGGGGEPLLQSCHQGTNYSQPRAPVDVFVSFCLWMCVIFFSSNKRSRKRHR